MIGHQLPAEFVYLSAVAPTIKQEVHYYTANNFTGHPVPGYKKPICILTRPAAESLLKVQLELEKKNLSLKVFDCYRPQMAVDSFIAWSDTPDDPKLKEKYYPHLNKYNLFKDGYISKKSGHTRGSTVDLTIVNLKTGHELDMGTHFDFLDQRSHPLSEDVTAEQKQNRLLLRSLMAQHGFKPLSTEWWHFTLENEPYPTTYFNFPVE